MSYPPPVQTYMPPAEGSALGYQRRQDEDHLGLLSLFHYILGGLTMLCSFVFLIYVFVGMAFVRSPLPMSARPAIRVVTTTPAGISTTSRQTFPAAPAVDTATDTITTSVSSDASAPNPMPQMGYFFVAMGVGGMLLSLVIGALNVYSGICIKNRGKSTFSIVIACIDCLSVPVGTLLGVFTLIVLSRPSVKSIYDPRLAVEPSAACPDR